MCVCFPGEELEDEWIGKKLGGIFINICKETEEDSFRKEPMSHVRIQVGGHGHVINWALDIRVCL